MWFGASGSGLELFCVSGVDYPLPKRQTIRICDGHEDLSSCQAIPEAIKFDEKPICVEIEL